MNVSIFCEYLKNPIGIDCEQPRFSWQTEENCGGFQQTGYRILIGREQEHLLSGQGIVWDSGVVLSAQSENIIYNGTPLMTACSYYYMVQVLDDAKEVHVSDTGVFTTGIMKPDQWQAMWVGSALMNQHTFWFRSCLNVDRKMVESAYAFVISPNYYVLTVNGNATTDTVLNNAWTDCEKSILYKTYEITNHLRQGENVFGIELGNGWNALEMGIDGDGLGEHQFSVQVYLKYTDGTSGWILSHPDDWKYTTEGPIKFNNIYHGEVYDARREIPGWDEPEYDLAGSELLWRDAVEFEPLKGIVRAEMMEPIKVVAEITPKQVYELPDHSFVYDMGQNFAGWVRIAVQEAEGTRIDLSYSELEHEDHTLNKMTLRGVRATDTYICKGDKTETYEPRFTYHGFRYVQISGVSKKPMEVTGCVVRSAVERIGHFQCSDPMLNQLQSNITWTEESNLHGLPTDCPQRDERLGWLNDMTVRNECAIYNFRLPLLYEKWLQDIRDAQGEVTGAITDTAPFRRFGSRPADPVSSSFLLIPWNIYCHYRDERIIRDNYEPMKRWIGYLFRNANDYILKYSHMGDWAAPIGGTDHNSVGGGAVSTITPTQLMATGYLYYDCILMVKMARVMGREEDAAYYTEKAEQVKEAFQHEYYNKKEKYYASNSQASNTFPLYLGLVPEEDKPAVLKNLIKDIKEHEIHLTTGNLCSRYLIEVLFQNHQEDLAYQLLTQTSYPGWGYMIENGATTIWERWEKIVDENSFLSHMASYNHPMNGAVGVCFYKYIVGINIDEEKPAFEHFTVKPLMPRALSSARACIETIRGEVAVEWAKDENFHVELKVRVPFNSTADIFLPIEHLNQEHITVEINGKEALDSDGRCLGVYDGFVKFRIQSGEHCFKVKD